MTPPRCPGCGGSGWREATPEEVSEQLRLDTDPTTVASRRGMWENSAVPCDLCEPRQYRLFRRGCMRPGHRCEECRPVRTSPKRRRRR